MASPTRFLLPTIITMIRSCAQIFFAEALSSALLNCRKDPVLISYDPTLELVKNDKKDERGESPPRVARRIPFRGRARNHWRQGGRPKTDAFANPGLCSTVLGETLRSFTIQDSSLDLFLAFTLQSHPLWISEKVSRDREFGETSRPDRRIRWEHLTRRNQRNS